MNVQEYIDWHSTLGHDEFYDMCPDLADPKAIGPAMAVALLTSMYGAIIANIIFMPLLVKLEGYTV